MLNTLYHQLTHTTLKNVELLKHSKIDKNASTCFGLHGNHLQGAKVSTWLKVTHLLKSRCVKDVQGVGSAMAAYSGVPRNFFWGGGSTNSVEDRENGDLGVVTP